MIPAHVVDGLVEVGSAETGDQEFFDVAGLGVRREPLFEVFEVALRGALEDNAHAFGCQRVTGSDRPQRVALDARCEHCGVSVSHVAFLCLP